MKKKILKTLVKSIKEAGRIHRGECPPSRVFKNKKKEASRNWCRND